MPYRLMLKSIRSSKGMRQSDMAEVLSMPLSTYRTWEQGVARITLEDACRIASVLGCTPNDLCGWYEDHPRPGAQAPPDPYAGELAACFEEAGGEGRRTILEVARAVRAASGEDAQRGGAGADGVA